MNIEGSDCMMKLSIACDLSVIFDFVRKRGLLGDKKRGFRKLLLTSFEMDTVGI